MESEIRPEHISEAAVRIRAIAHRTPVLTSRSFNDEAGITAFLKCENFQRGGAFKIRGASNFIFSIAPEELSRGVVGYSSGNHAQAVAIAARYVNIPATLLMPRDAPRSKIDATRAQGASILYYDRFTESREEKAAAIVAETGATLVPPYDHPHIIAGQGTAGLELLQEVPYLDALIAPVGGGGLLAGCAIAARSANRRIRIFAAEPENANDTYLSLRARQHVEIPQPNTIADGLGHRHPGKLTFPILQRLLEQVVLVSEEEIKMALKFLLMRLKILVEPSGAVAAAAVLAHKLPDDVGTVGVILSGGNMDYETLVGL